MLVANVSAFGVDCSNADHPYLYWEYVDDESGLKRDPIAANVHTADVGLRFRFFIDQDGDGQSDTTVAKPTFDVDPAVATNDDVVAIEVLVQLRSEKADPQLQTAGSDPYRPQNFVRVIRTPNINTRASQYIFVHNSGI
jgi:hypothetical protein